MAACGFYQFVWSHDFELGSLCLADFHEGENVDEVNSIFFYFEYDFLAFLVLFFVVSFGFANFFFS